MPSITSHVRCCIDLNLPLSGVAFALVTLFLRVRTPPGTLKEKLARMDLT